MSSKSELLSARVEHQRIATALGKLNRALNAGRSRKWCLRLWRRFILERDGWKCLMCSARDRLVAHHIFRRAVFPQAQFQTGNGVTLCRGCHCVVHEVWNRRPGPGEPLNERGGDDQDYGVEIWFAMELDAAERGILYDEFYTLSEDFVCGLAALQGMNIRAFESIDFPGPSITLARLVWEQCPQPGARAIGGAVLECLMAPAADFWSALERRLYVIH